jgi:hypothetical protein
MRPDKSRQRTLSTSSVITAAVRLFYSWHFVLPTSRSRIAFVTPDSLAGIMVAYVVMFLGVLFLPLLRAREMDDGFVDINFHIHVRDADGTELAWPIESYNPYFGCDVGFIRWMNQSLVVIYREKHRTYVCSAAPGKAPVFRIVADDWVISGGILAYWDWKETSVSRLTLPALMPLEPLSEDEARAQSVLPSKYW